MKKIIIGALAAVSVGCLPVSYAGTNNNQQFVAPTNSAWAYYDGPWKSVNLPFWGTVMQGALNSTGQQHYGRRAAIMTDSSYVILKQRAVYGLATVFVDGKIAKQINMPSNGSLIQSAVYTGKRGWHTVEIVDSLNCEVDGLYVSPTAQVKKPVVPAKKLIVIGHSYAEGSNASNHGINDFAALLGPTLGVQSINQGVGGTDVDVDFPSNVSDSGLDRVQKDVIDQHPNEILVVYGLNVTSRIAQGQLSHAKYQADYTTFLKDIRAKLPNVPIFCSGITAVPAWSDQALIPFNQDIQNAVKSVSKCYYIDPTGWLSQSNFSKYISFDHVHPSDAGHLFLAQKYATAIKYFLAHPNDNGVKQTVTGSVYGN